VSETDQQQKIIELVIRLGVLLVLILWCFTIIEPFVLIIAWGAIVAIALFPVGEKLAAFIGGRMKPASILLTLTLISILVVPAYLLADSLVLSAQTLAEATESGQLQIPPPTDAVAEWPLIGPAVHETWQQAATNLPAVLEDFAPQIKSFATWLLNTITGLGLTILQFIISFVIAGVLLNSAESGTGAVERLATKLTGGRGPEFAKLSTGTIRNVAIGIVGVSVIQTVLLTIGFLLVDLPAAGLAALLVLVLCIIQLGPGLVSLVAIIYVFSTMDTLPATLFTIWTVVMTLIDSVLKPMVFSRGASVPTLVIFLGAIGGMVAYGIIGLFVGAVVLSVGFKLYAAWVGDAENLEQAAAEQA